MTDAASIAVTQSNTAESTGDAAQESTVTDGDNSTVTTDGVTGTEGNQGTENAGTEGNQGTENAGEGGNQTESSETYADFTLLEGVELDTQLLGEATPLFKELGLTQEQAQKLVDLQSKHVQASQQGQAEAFNQLKLDWQEQSKSDSEIGGDKFEQSVSDAREALGKFGTPELTKLLNDFGIGNHPEMIRFMAKVGTLTREDVPGSGDASQAKKDRVSILYPTDS